MWANPSQQSQPNAGNFGFQQPNTGIFGQTQPAGGTGIFGNQPPASSGTGLFGTGFNNSSAIPMPTSQPNTGFGGVFGGMQLNNNPVGQSSGTTGLFGGMSQQTQPAMGMNNSQGMGQGTSVFPNTSSGGNGIFGGQPNSGGVFGNQPTNTSGIFAPKPQTGNTGMFNTPSFGTPNPQQQPQSFLGNQSQATGGIFGGQQQTQNSNNFQFGQQQQQAQPNSIFGGSKPSSGFLGGSAQPNNTFGFQSGTSTGFGNTPNFGGNMANSMANNMAKPTQFKKFQPSKPKNESVSKEKNSNAVVACITNSDEYHQFSKEEVRIMYLQNPSAFQVQQQQPSGMFSQQTTNSGMFMQPQQQTSNTMFGQTAQNTGGLFGQPQQQQQMGAGGMFSQPQNSGTMNPGFGGMASSSTPSFGSGLFGNNQTQSAAQPNTGLFGNKPLTPNTMNVGNALAANLFTATTGQQPQQQQTGGLFGSTTPTTGLFSTPQPQQQQQGGSLLGQQPSLFGAPANPQPAPGSLFGTSPGLFGSTPSPGGLFSAPTGNLATGQQIQQAVATSVSLFAASQPQQQQPLQQQQTPSLFGSTPLFANPQLQQQAAPNGISMMAPINVSGGQTSVQPGLFTPPERKYIFSSTPYNQMMGPAFHVRPVSATPAYSTDSLFVSTPQVAQMSNLIASNLMNSFSRKDNEAYNRRSIYSDQLYDYESARKQIRRRFEKDMVEKLSTVGYTYPDYSAVEYNMSKKNSYERERFGDNLYNTGKRPSIVYERPELFPAVRNEDGGESRYSGLAFEEPETRKCQPAREKEQPEQKASAAAGDKLASLDEIPTCKHMNVTPSIIELSRMTTNQLKQVHNLVVWNDFGKVEWKDPVNLLRVNIDDWVKIKKSTIEIEDVLTRGGTCTLYFFNFGNYTEKAKNSVSLRNFKTKMSHWLQANKLKLISFSDTDGELIAQYDGSER